MPLVLDTGGSATLTVDADPGLVGISIFLQGLAVDPGGALVGIGSLTQGLELVVGP